MPGRRRGRPARPAGRASVEVSGGCRVVRAGARGSATRHGRRCRAGRRPARASSRSSVPTQAVGGAGAGLVQEARSRRTRRAPRGRRVGRVARRASAADELDLDDGDAGGGEARASAAAGSSNATARWQVSTQTPIRVGVDRGERCVDGLGGGLDDAAGLGFEATRIGAPGRRPRASSRSARAVSAVGARPGGRPSTGARQASGRVEMRAPDGVVRQQRGQHAGQVEGVVEPLGLGPVRLVDAVLDHLGAGSAS